VGAGRICLVVVCAAALAVAAAGCGGGGSTSYSGTSPDDWAAAVCGGLNDWTQSLKSDSQMLASGVAGAGNLDTAKAKLILFLQHAEQSTRTMNGKVRAAGAPAVKDGEALQRDLQAGLDGAEASFRRATARAKKLSTTDNQSFYKGFLALGQDIQNELADTGRTFDGLSDKYDAKDLNEAVAKQPACKQLTSAR
jgi:hypothetical protein